ncbi:uncharacterized protein BKA78DRAFT_345187 [Phyllosticta capitalensis]|uniref:uncharacterized protein n=1 Tax=Phyllosticta capitalensis TaxID=121624 RepID=UPI003131ADA6
MATPGGCWLLSRLSQHPTIRRNEVHRLNLSWRLDPSRPCWTDGCRKDFAIIVSNSQTDEMTRIPPSSALQSLSRARAPPLRFGIRSQKLRLHATVPRGHPSRPSLQQTGYLQKQADAKQNANFSVVGDHSETRCDESGGLAGCCRLAWNSEVAGNERLEVTDVWRMCRAKVHPRTMGDVCSVQASGRRASDADGSTCLGMRVANLWTVGSLISLRSASLSSGALVANIIGLRTNSAGRKLSRNMRISVFSNTAVLLHEGIGRDGVPTQLTSFPLSWFNFNHLRFPPLHKPTTWRYPRSSSELHGLPVKRTTKRQLSDDDHQSDSMAAKRIRRSSSDLSYLSSPVPYLSSPLAIDSSTRPKQPTKDCESDDEATEKCLSDYIAELDDSGPCPQPKFTTGITKTYSTKGSTSTSSGPTSSSKSDLSVDEILAEAKKCHTLGLQNVESLERILAKDGGLRKNSHFRDILKLYGPQTSVLEQIMDTEIRGFLLDQEKAKLAEERAALIDDLRNLTEQQGLNSKRAAFFAARRSASGDNTRPLLSSNPSRNSLQTQI